VEIKERDGESRVVFLSIYAMMSDFSSYSKECLEKHQRKYYDDIRRRVRLGWAKRARGREEEERERSLEADYISSADELSSS